MVYSRGTFSKVEERTGNDCIDLGCGVCDPSLSVNQGYAEAAAAWLKETVQFWIC